MQDVRGKYGSEGDYVMTRPLHGPLNPTTVDHSTDTYDTIDWLVKNVPESNGKVGILGISYDGFLPLMALVNPHPALKVAVPMNPMVDGWRGDDWFHNGAFRQQMMPYIYDQEATRDNSLKWWSNRRTTTTCTWRPGRPANWDDRAASSRRASGARSSSTRRTTRSGASRRWTRSSARSRCGCRRCWCTGCGTRRTSTARRRSTGRSSRRTRRTTRSTWSPGRGTTDSRSATAARSAPSASTATPRKTFRRDVLGPFLAQYLKDGAPKAEIAPVTVFETGTNTWRRLNAWPAGCVSGCRIAPTPLYLGAGQTLGFDAPKAGAQAFAEYVSDPSKPVPYRPRPIGSTDGPEWATWLVSDQRESSGRTDVLSFVSAVLKEPVKISGQPVVNLVASTSGTDSDWVVKLIDVYPDQVPSQPSMGGYQLMVSADIFRGRYREGFDTPKALTPDAPLTYRFDLPNANHVFLPGHRIMVQVQSSWFPLYDRNPQTFVPNIFWAKPEDYRKAVQRVYHAPGQASFIEIPMVVK